MSKANLYIFLLVFYVFGSTNTSFASTVDFACRGIGSNPRENITISGRYVISQETGRYTIIGSINVTGSDETGASLVTRNGQSRDFSKHRIFVGSSNDLFELIASRNGQDNIVIRHSEGNAADDLIQIDLPASGPFEWYANQYTNAKCRFR